MAKLPKGAKGTNNKWGQAYQVNNLVTFRGEPMGSEELLIQTVETFIE